MEGSGIFVSEKILAKIQKQSFYRVIGAKDVVGFKTVKKLTEVTVIE